MTQAISDDQQQILDQLVATFHYLPDNPERSSVLRPWLQWQVGHILDALGPDDLTDAELVGLVGLLGGPFSRLLARRVPPRPAKRLRAV